MITATTMKKQKILKTPVGIFKNMGGNILDGSFPDTNFRKYNIKHKILKCHCGTYLFQSNLKYIYYFLCKLFFKIVFLSFC